MKGIRIIWKSHSSTSKKGYLRLSVRKSEIGKTKIISLNLPPISENHFDKKNQRVKSSHKNHEEYNMVIEKTLKQYDVRKSTEFIKDEKKTLNYFVENFLIPYAKSIGTKEKYRNILNLLILYNKEKFNRDEVLLKSIDVNFINDWKQWLRTERKLTENTISYKTKTFSSFISKSINQGYYVFVPNPFKAVKNVIADKMVEYLTEDEIYSLINTDLFEINRNNKDIGTKKDIINKSRYKNRFTIDEVRNWFLFSLFQHGLRVSDVMTIRWKNLYIDNNELRMSKRMIKTKHSIKSLIYPPSIFILKNYIPDELITEEEKIKIKDFNVRKNMIQDFKKSINEDYNVLLKFENKYDFDFEKVGDAFLITEKKCDELIKKITDELSYKLVGLFDIRKFDFDYDEKLMNDERLVQLKKLKQYVQDHQKENLNRTTKNENEIDSQAYDTITNIIQRVINHPDYSNSFIFPILNNDDFKNIVKEEDFDRMDKKQYLKFVGRRSYYNRLLRFVGNQCGISNLTSHKSRHSYTSLILKYNKEINLYDLMESLGHKNLSTTQSYIQNFVNIRVDEIGKNFSKKFNS
jgi:integrase